MADLQINGTGVTTNSSGINTLAANGGTRSFILFNESEAAIKVTFTGSTTAGAEAITLSISNGGNDERARHPANRQFTMDGYTGALVQVTNNHTAVQTINFAVRTLHGTQVGDGVGNDLLIAHRDTVRDDDDL